MVTIAVLALSACGSSTGTPAAADVPQKVPSVGTSLQGPVPAAVLDAQLIDSHGHATSLGALKGKVIVLADFMTLCAEVCPIVTASMLQAARHIDRSAFGAQVEFVSLTIDPARDDNRHLRAYRRTFGDLPNWEVLGGAPATVDAVWKRLGIWIHQTHNSRPYPTDWVTGKPLTTDLSHTDELIFIDGDQQYRYEIDGTGSVASPRVIPDRLYRFMDALGHRNVKSPSSASWSPSQVVDVVQWMVGGSS